MKRVLRLLKPHAGWLVGSILFSLISTIMQILLPIYTKQVNSAILSGDEASLKLNALYMLGFSVAGVITSILNTFFSTKTSVGYSITLRNYVFDKVSHLSQSNIDRIGVPSLVTRTTNDVRQIHDIVLQTLKSLLPIPIMLVAGLVMIFSLYADVAKKSLWIIPVMAVLAIILIAIIVPMYTKVQKLLDKLNGMMREKIGGIRVIRAFNRTEYEDERFAETNTRLTRLSLIASRIIAGLLPVLTLALYGFIVMLMLTLTKSVNALDPNTQRQEIMDTIPNLTAFVSYFSLLIGAIVSVVGIVVNIPRASVSGKRVREILDAEPDVLEPETPVPSDPAHLGEVEFRNVTFRYKPAPEDGKKKKKFGKKEEAPKEQPKPFCLENVSFVSRPGEMTAIIGITGSGKSTLLNLIPRLYDVDEGEVLVNGVNVKDLAGEELLKSIAIVPQQAFLFSGTVADNVRFGQPDATDNEVWRALEIAQAKSFVSAMPEGADSFVSQAGKNYSGGQKQRLAIARAVVKNAPIMLFDDSFSALDLATDARLRASLRESLTNTNLIIVAQRVGTVLNADRIIVLEDGKVVGIGKHQELIRTCDVYRELVVTQLSEEALEGGDAYVEG